MKEQEDNIFKDYDSENNGKDMTICLNSWQKESPNPFIAFIYLEDTAA